MCVLAYLCLYTNFSFTWVHEHAFLAFISCSVSLLISCHSDWCIFARFHRMKMVDAKLAVEDANTQFYDAFRNGDVQVTSLFLLHFSKLSLSPIAF